jgi:hypothetical protein
MKKAFFITYLLFSLHLNGLDFVEIYGRDEGNVEQRQPIYRIRAPTDWRMTNQTLKSVADTKKPIGEWVISEGEESLTITIHNFPLSSLEARIPPAWQINRWKKQFDLLEEEGFHITPLAYGGFSGLALEATGMQKGKKVSLLAWAMQLGDEHFRNLSYSNIKPSKKTQMLSDYTIKAIGPTFLIEKHKSSLEACAKSFEHIEEIPEAL